jgi:hypothetical protein
MKTFGFLRKNGVAGLIQVVTDTFLLKSLGVGSFPFSKRPPKSAQISYLFDHDSGAILYFSREKLKNINNRKVSAFFK